LVSAVEDLILSEVNVKEIEYINEDSGILVKKIKPNFKSLGPKYGKLMKQLAAAINQFTQDDIRKFEHEDEYQLTINNEVIILNADDIEISTEDIPGWSVANQDHITVALDMTLTAELMEEGLARELVNRVQNLRKEKGFEVTDRIILHIEKNKETLNAFNNFKDYVCSETLSSMFIEEKLNNESEEFELIDDIKVKIFLEKE
jgi:isoleucyl-tRNA synthetase